MRVSAPTVSCLSDTRVYAWAGVVAFALTPVPANALMLLTSASTTSDMTSLLAIIAFVSPLYFETEADATGGRLIVVRTSAPHRAELHFFIKSPEEQLNLKQAKQAASASAAAHVAAG